MTKQRLLSLLLALCLVLSLALVSCGKDAGKKSEETEEETRVEELSAKAIFNRSFSSAMAGSGVGSFSGFNHAVLQGKITLPEALDESGTLGELFKLPLSFSAEVQTDEAKGISSLQYTVSLKDGNAGFDLLLSQEELILTKLLLPLETPLAVPLELAALQGSDEEEEIPSAYITALSQLFSENKLPESAYTMAQETVTILDRTYTNATVITLTADQSLLPEGEFPVSAFSLSLQNVIEDGRSVALQGEIKLEEDTATIAYASDSQGATALLETPEGSLSLESATDVQGKFTASLEEIHPQTKQRTLLLSVSGQKTPTSFDGTVTLYSEDEPAEFTVKTTAEREKGSVELTAEGFFLSASYSVTGAALKGEFSIELEDEEISLGMEGAFTADRKSASLSLPEETVSPEDFQPSQEWLEDVLEQYPSLISLFLVAA